MPATSNKKSNSDYLMGAKKENQIKAWGGINRKTLAVDTNIRNKFYNYFLKPEE